jgi:hypothetical protein
LAVCDEAIMQQGLSEPGDNFGRYIFLVELVKAEIDGSAGMNGSEKEQHVTEGDDLILDEVIPGAIFVVDDKEGRSTGGSELLEVLIESVDGAQVAEVPVKGGIGEGR